MEVILTKSITLLLLMTAALLNNRDLKRTAHENVILQNLLPTELATLIIERDRHHLLRHQQPVLLEVAFVVETRPSDPMNV